ncbi:DUF7373 family lipoprotein [Nocardia miyunensis]|uniref:DUF7373 family lipoprotein n=1 Tax=Nocardia miyunensis TaxID=282684 RepID=UPI00082D1CEA|nr:hypothetical protein [Nocardia miyunensis]
MTRPSLARGIAAAVGGITAAVMLTSCGTSVSGIAAPAELDVRTLDVGPYPVDPIDIHEDDPPGLIYGLQVGGLRLSDYVVDAYDIDPHMTVGLRSGSFTSGVIARGIGNDTAMTAVAKRDNMYFGFESVGSDRPTYLSTADWPAVVRSNTTSIDLMVMQFPDADTATRAAGDFYNADIGLNKNQPLTVSKYPAAHAHWRPGTATVRSFIAHGSYVVAVLALAPSADPANLTTLVQKSYDAEFPLLDQLRPISDEDTVRLDWDPEYLISRTLNSDKIGNIGYGDTNAAFGPRGIMHYMPDRAQAKKTFTAIEGVKFAKTDDALLVRTADAAAAHEVVRDRLTPQPFEKAAAAVPKLPGSACVENNTDTDSYITPKRYTCIVAYRNYLAYVDSDQLIDAHQRAAAQYALLANSQWEP